VLSKIKSVLKSCVDNWQATLYLLVIILVIVLTVFSSIDEASTRTSAHLPARHTTTAGTRYILNTNTYKFHYPSCGSVRMMNESNLIEFTGSREEVIARGYDPCGKCNP